MSENITIDLINTEDYLDLYKENEDLNEYLNENSALPILYALKNKNKSVSIFSDKNKINNVTLFPANYSSIPTKKNKYVMLNCCRYRLIWL
jgi:hypothetical protein